MRYPTSDNWSIGTFFPRLNFRDASICYGRLMIYLSKDPNESRISLYETGECDVSKHIYSIIFTTERNLYKRGVSMGERI